MPLSHGSCFALFLLFLPTLSAIFGTLFFIAISSFSLSLNRGEICKTITILYNCRVSLLRVFSGRDPPCLVFVLQSSPLFYASLFLNFSYFERRGIPKLFISSRGATTHEYQKDISPPHLMVIEQSKSGQGEYMLHRCCKS